MNLAGGAGTRHDPGDVGTAVDKTIGYADRASPTFYSLGPFCTSCTNSDKKLPQGVGQGMSMHWYR